MSFLLEAVTFLLAILAGLGVGSGGLFLVFLTEVMGIPAADSAVGNLLFFIAALAAATVVNLRKGRLDGAFFLKILLYGTPGALLGRWVFGILPDDVRAVFLGVFLIGAGIFSFILLRPAAKNEKKKKDRPSSLDKPARQRYNNTAI